MKKKGHLKKILKFISDVISWTCLCILILIGICIIWYIIQTKIYASKGEKYKPYFSLYTIISPSMEPKIKVYDVILDTRVDSPNEIRVGDIITFVSTSSLSNGMIITHRVIDIVNENGKISYVTKGDNNDSPDGATAHYENVVGKTILKIPMLGRVQFLLANKGVWIIVVMIPALGIIAYDMLKLFKNSNLKIKLEDMVDDTPKKDNGKQKELEEKRKEELKEKLLNVKKNNTEVGNNTDKKYKEVSSNINEDHVDLQPDQILELADEYEKEVLHKITENENNIDSKENIDVPEKKSEQIKKDKIKNNSSKKRLKSKKSSKTKSPKSDPVNKNLENFDEIE